MSDPFKDVADDSSKEASPEVLYWIKEIHLAGQREKRFRKEAEEVVKLYEADKPSANSFNILYANTETLLPAVYNQLPRPMVERRFEDADPLGKQAAEVLERTLSYLVDSPDQEYDQYDDLFQQAALGALVPGRGVTRFRYDPKIEDSATSVGDGEGDSEDEGDEAKAVANEQENTGKIFPKANGKVTWETICGEDIDYDMFLMGYARRWINVPWISFEHAMSREDAEENFGKRIAEKMKFAAPVKEGSQGWKVEDDQLTNRGSTETAVVYEIWWKQRKQVVFYHPELKDELCLALDDPYELTGFYPCPEPLRMLIKRSGLVPTPLYKVYEAQAKELNKITLRIARIVNALKVRGFYDGTLQGLKELLSADDNTLIPAKNVAAMQQGQNIQNSVWFMPLEELIKVLNQLYEAQVNCKNTIYEITGIADIMRGDTQASETATAQSIKSKWGSLRLQKMQGAVQNYIRDSLRIVAELAGKHFGVQTFAAMTNLDYATPEDVQKAQGFVQAVNKALSQIPLPAAQMPPPPGSPPVPPPAPQIPPQVQQMQQQAQAILSKPRWEDVLKLLKDDLLRGYRVDIETNSTLANTSSEDQQNITNAMTALSNMFQSFLPAVQEGALTMPALKEMTLAVARRFEFGRQVETSISAMPDQLPPPPPDPKINADLEKQKQDFAQQQMAQQQDMAQKSQDLAAREAAMGQKAQEVAGDIASAKDEVAMTAREAQSAQEISQQKFLLQMEQRLSKHEMTMQKGIQQQKATAAKQQQDQAKAALQTQPPKEDMGMQKLMEGVQELLKARDAPIKFLHGEDGKTSHVQVGEKLRTIKRDSAGKISELH